MHGLGNDFVILDTKLNPKLFNDKNQFTLTKSQIAHIANRHSGIGCDQLLIIKQSNLTEYQFDYFIYNSDGSEALYCGNGARCVIKYIQQNYQYFTISLNTNGNITNGIVKSDGMVTISIKSPEFDPVKSGYKLSKKISDSYQAGEICFGIVSIGNPHAIIRLELENQLHQLSKLEKIALRLQHSDVFSDSVNVSFFVINNSKHLQMLTYERGCGFTRACGSGACAVASYAIKNKWVSNNNLRISQTGGDVYISWDMGHELVMTGDAIFVFEGTINL